MAAEFKDGVLNKGSVDFNALFKAIAAIFDAIAKFFQGEYAVKGDD